MTVQMALVPYSIEPDTSDWKTAQWDGGYAKVKIGAGSTVGALTEGTYGVWIRVTTTDEIPVLYAGAVRIT
ncbi:MULTISPECIES: hypothetical protein [Streptosporangiaceae]|uniref:hypothetical protein n=1 Tax=Streptosporangiaceae TaxID=2004 RepID=UPI0034007AF9